MALLINFGHLTLDINSKNECAPLPVMKLYVKSAYCMNIFQGESVSAIYGTAVIQIHLMRLEGII